MESIIKSKKKSGLFSDVTESLFQMPTKVLVVDDDPVFLKNISFLAKKRNINLTVCSSLDELKSLKDRNSYKVALVDYYIGDILNGADVAGIMGPTPVVMMSSNSEKCLEENMIWPPSVRKFVSKSEGLSELLNVAMRVSNNKYKA